MSTTDTETSVTQRVRVFIRWVESRPDLSYQLAVTGRYPTITFVCDTPAEADALADTIPFTSRGEWAQNLVTDSLGVLYGQAWGIRVSVLARGRYPAAVEVSA